MIGQTLGHYRIVEKLGEGGMGVVYRARDENLNRDIAIKVLPEAFTDDRERLARFSREAQLLASLNHPNIAAIYGLEEQDGLRYLVLEYVPGQTLAERLKRGALAAEEAFEICKQIAEALEAAHEKGIIHRDLKPANVKITPEDKVKVLDFGLAKALQAEGSAADLSKSPTISAAATRAGVILGTAVYMSPEQARGKTVDKRTDIWAFGCVLYECLSGKRAFSGESLTDTLAAIVKGEPDWSALPAETPPQVRALLRRCLQKDPRERLRDAGDARLELGEALAAPPAPAPTAAIRVSLASRPWKWVLACAALLLAALAGVFLGRWRWQTPASAPRAPVRFSLPLAAKERLATGFSPSLAFSPDGSRLVYVVARAGTTELVVRSLDRLEATTITGTEGARGPFFSPDGQWVGFSVENRVKKVPLNGGAPVVVTDKPSHFGSAWAPDGTILFTPSFTEGIWRVPASGGSAQPFVLPDRTKGERNCFFPEILPDGKSVLFTIRQTEASEGRLAIQSLSGGGRAVLAVEGTHGRYLPTGHLVYTRSGRLFALPFDLSRMEPTGPPTAVLEGVAISPDGAAHFSFSFPGAMAYLPAGKTGAGSTLVWVDRKGKEQPLLTRPRAYLEPRFSPDGRRLALEITAPNHDLWVYELERETLTRVTFDGDSHGAVWTPDGKRLTYRSGAPGSIFWKAADGSGGAEQLIKGETRQYPDSWSPDGRFLLFEETRPSTGRDIWVLDMAAGRKAQPLVHTSFNETLPALSPDGRWLAYVSDESGRPEVYVQPFPGPGGKWQVSADGGTQPVWARNGRELFYRSGDKMLAVAIVTQPSFAAGKQQVLFEANYEAGIAGRPNYDLTPDGSRFVMVKGETEAAATHLNVVLNWFEELKGRATPGPKQ